MLELLEIKQQLHSKCFEIAQQRVMSLSTIIQEAQDAANNETKSSAGDKHETGRAMAQLEQEKNAVQLSEALKLRAALNGIDPSELHTESNIGSLITTNMAIFYLSVGLGQVKVEEEEAMVISIASPIGALLVSAKVGDTISFNGKEIKVIEIS